MCVCGMLVHDARPKDSMAHGDHLKARDHSPLILLNIFHILS